MSLYSLTLRSVALPLVSSLTESKFWDLVRPFQRDPASLFAPDPETIISRLRKLVQHAFDHAPYYREKLGRVGLAPKDIQNFDIFRRIPPTPKSEIAANFPSRITADTKPFQPWRFASTSGTVERLTAVHDFRKRDYGRATQALSLYFASGYQLGMKYLELPPDLCRFVCGGGSTDLSLYQFLLERWKQGRIREQEVLSTIRGFCENQLVYRRLQLPAFPSRSLIQKPEVLETYLDLISNYKPHVAKLLPVNLYMLAVYMLETGRRIPKIEGGLMPMGGSITPHMKKVIERAFGTKVVEDYGCAELGGMGAESDGIHGIRPFSALMHLEVVTNGRLAKPGEIGEVYVSDLYNFAMPFIRYRIGDVARVLDSDGRIEIVGRLADCIQGEYGPVTADDTVEAFLPHPGIAAFQMEARPNKTIEVQIVPKNDNFNIDDARDIAIGLLGKSMKIAIRMAPTVMNEPGGKFRFVRNLSGTPVTL